MVYVNPEKPGRFTLRMRIPGWANNQPVPGDLYTYTIPENFKPIMMVNNEPFIYKEEKGYAVAERDWKKGDVVRFAIPMEIHVVKANPKVAEDAGKIAIERGPFVFCLEGVDNGKQLNNFVLPDNPNLKVGFDKDILNGLLTITGDALVSGEKTPRNFRAIPYFLWNNRGINEMKVWLPTN